MEKKHLGYIVGLLILIALIFYLRIDLRIFLQVKHYNILLLSFVLFMLSFIFLGYRMKFLLKALGSKPLPAMELTKIEFINKFVAYIMPSRINVFVKGLILSEKCNMQKSKTVSLATYEYALDTGFILFLSIIGVFFFFRGLPYNSPQNFMLFSTIVLVFLFVFFKIPQKWFEYLLKRSEKIKNHFLKKPVYCTSKLLNTIRITWIKIALDKNNFIVIVLLFAYWLWTAIYVELMFLSYDLYIPLGYIIIVLATSQFIGGLFQLPGGLGTRDAARVAFFALIGTKPEIALAVVIIQRILSIPALLLGYVFFTKMAVDKVLERKK